MKIGCVIHRYGAGIMGGAELHCRLIAEMLSARNAVEVFTTCATDYLTWANEMPPGTETIHGVTVHRHCVRRTRNLKRFNDIQNEVFHFNPTPELEDRWIRENGPYSPALVNAVAARVDIDRWLLFSYRYWTTVEALRRLGSRALLVPTAEHDEALKLNVFKSLFQMPGAIVYNSIEERQLIHGFTGNSAVPGDVVGVGIVETPEPGWAPYLERFRQYVPYLIYVGRIDRNKGCEHLFRHFIKFCGEVRSDIQLLLIGSPVMPVPAHPNIIHLQGVADDVKSAAIRASAVLVMPSRYESLSMVLLEAWCAGRPVIANRRCEVLEGQCMRSGGGLPYLGYEEFVACVGLLVDRPELADRLGRQGQAYFRANYDWAVIRDKYDQLLGGAR